MREKTFQIDEKLKILNGKFYCYALLLLSKVKPKKCCIKKDSSFLIFGR